MMIKEFLALEQAIASLEMIFQSIEFNDEQEAGAVARRIANAEKRLISLYQLCSPESAP